jgi:hypothetical protein
MGVTVAVGAGVRVCVASGTGVFVEVGIADGNTGISVTALLWAAQALRKREIVIKTNKVFFITELLLLRKQKQAIYYRLLLFCCLDNFPDIRPVSS